MNTKKKADSTHHAIQRRVPLLVQLDARVERLVPQQPRQRHRDLLLPLLAPVAGLSTAAASACFAAATSPAAGRPHGGLVLELGCQVVCVHGELTCAA